MLLWFCVVTTCGSAAAAASEVRAGVARETFVLPQRIPLAGYSRRHGKPSHGVHDPVGVRALVIRDEHTTAVLVSCDLLIVDEDLFNAVHERLMARGLPHDTVLLLAATHTHSGPGAYGKKFFEKLSMGHFDPRVFETLVETITQTIKQAYAHCAPTRLASWTQMTQNLVVNRVDPDGFADAELVVSAFYRMDTAQPFAVLVNFAAHPTTLGARNMELSAEYPGVVMREIERRVPGVTCFFFAGDVGDQAPVKLSSGFDRAEQIGLRLAQQMIPLFRNASPETPQAIHALQEELPLPPARVRLGRSLSLPGWMSRRLVDDDATLTLMTLDKTAFIGVPCDCSAVLGRDLKTSIRSRGYQPMLIGFASDYIGYCMPSALYNARVYETLMAFNGPKTGELIVERLKQMLDKLVTSGE